MALFAAIGVWLDQPSFRAIGPKTVDETLVVGAAMRQRHFNIPERSDAIRREGAKGF